MPELMIAISLEIIYALTPDTRQQVPDSLVYHDPLSLTEVILVAEFCLREAYRSDQA